MMKLSTKQSEQQLSINKLDRNFGHMMRYGCTTPLPRSPNKKSPNRTIRSWGNIKKCGHGGIAIWKVKIFRDTQASIRSFPKAGGVPSGTSTHI